MTNNTEINKESIEAGRGVFAITSAKLYFMIVGSILTFSLPTIFGPVLFGAYQVVVSTVSPINNVLIVATIQAMARFTTNHPDNPEIAKRIGLLMHFRIGVPLAIVFMLCSPLIANFLHDENKIIPIALASVIIMFYSLYAVLIGYQNGLRRFDIQARFDMTAVTIRAALIIVAAALGFGVIGAISAWGLAAMTMFVIAAVVTGIPTLRSSNETRQYEKKELRSMIFFFCGVSVYFIIMNFVMVIDSLLLKRFATEWFLQNGVPDCMENIKSCAASSSDRQVGYYAAAQALSRLSYQSIVAILFVAFPLISKATFNKNEELARSYVQTTVRYVLLLGSMVAVVFVANPYGILGIPFSDEYAINGQSALTALALGNIGFCLMVICGTLLTGAGAVRSAIKMITVTLIIAVLGMIVIVPGIEPGAHLLQICGLITAFSMGVGAVLGGIIVKRKFGVFLSIQTVLRVAVAGAVGIALGRMINTESVIMLLAEVFLVVVVFVAVLFVLRELTSKDIAAFKKLIKKVNP